MVIQPLKLCLWVPMQVTLKGDKGTVPNGKASLEQTRSFDWPPLISRCCVAVCWRPCATIRQNRRVLFQFRYSLCFCIFTSFRVNSIMCDYELWRNNYSWSLEKKRESAAASTVNKRPEHQTKSVLADVTHPSLSFTGFILARDLKYGWRP